MTSTGDSGSFVDRPVRVRVPATSANLGPGFDALGLALSLYDEVTAEITEGGLSIDVQGEGAGAVAGDETHLIVQSMRAAFGLFGVQPAGLRLQCANVIPHGRGLGSSAAAIVAGILLAQGLTRGATATSGQLLTLAASLEGHPDNVAPCLLGGLTIAWTQSDGTTQAVRLDAIGVTPIALIPEVQSSTKAARQALPASVTHADAAFNAARSALLVAALTSGDAAVLLEATQDRLHQSYRAAGMPESTLVLARLRANGVPAVISGAGPTVLALARSQAEVQAAKSVAPAGWRAEVLAIDQTGASVVSVA
jgi:homoserine kinase